MTPALMDDFPPAPDRLVTLANWRKPPFSAWGFRNVRRLIPTANIAASDTMALEVSPEEFGHIGFAGHDGNPTTVAQALRATQTGDSSCSGAGVLRRVVRKRHERGHAAHVFSVSKSICGTLGNSLTAACSIPTTASSTTSPNESSVYARMHDPASAGHGGRHRLQRRLGDPEATWHAIVMRWGGIHCRRARHRSDLRGFLGQQKPDGRKHGELFHYVSTNTDVLDWVYERACDQPYAEILSEYLWAPLGAERDGYITVDAHDAMRAAGGVCVTPRDLARFGEMIRRRGVADGRQVVPGSWIDDINERGSPEAWAASEFAEVFPQASYRSQWYRIDSSKRVLVAFGIHGQWISYPSEAELVIIRIASEATPLDRIGCAAGGAVLTRRAAFVKLAHQLSISGNGA